MKNPIVNIQFHCALIPSIQFTAFVINADRTAKATYKSGNEIFVQLAFSEDVYFYDASGNPVADTEVNSKLKLNSVEILLFLKKIVKLFFGIFINKCFFLFILATTFD